MKRWLVVAGLMGAVVALDNIKGCGPDPQPSSIAWDGEAYTVVWAAPSSLKVTVWAARLHDKDFRGGGDQSAAPSSAQHLAGERVGIASASRYPERVIRLSSLAATPEIVRGDGGFMVLVLGGDGRLHAVPLDERGRRINDGAVIASGVDRLCVRPVSFGRHVAGESGVIAQSPAKSGDKHYAASYLTDSKIHLIALDQGGVVTGRESFDVVAPTGCAMAAGDGRMAVVVSGSARDAIRHAASGLLVELAESAGPLRLIRADGGWALLHRASAGLQISEIGDGGGLGRVIRVADGVDPGSVDLARNDAGLWVSWLDGREVRWMFAPGKQSDSFRTEGSPLGTRALGHGDTCAMTWTTGGSRVWVLRAPGCGPR